MEFNQTMKFKLIKLKDLNKVRKTQEETENCIYCNMQQQKIAECVAKQENMNIVEVSIKSVLSVSKHILKCSDCRVRLNLIRDCAKHGHKT